jgi:hypothetical protein
MITNKCSLIRRLLIRLQMHPLLRRSGNAFKAGTQLLYLRFKQSQKKHLDPWYKHSGMTSKKIKQKMITNKCSLIRRLLIRLQLPPLLRRSGNAFKAGTQLLYLRFKQSQKKHLDPW